MDTLCGKLMNVLLVGGITPLGIDRGGEEKGKDKKCERETCSAIGHFSTSNYLRKPFKIGGVFSWSFHFPFLL